MHESRKEFNLFYRGIPQTLERQTGTVVRGSGNSGHFITLLLNETIYMVKRSGYIRAHPLIQVHGLLHHQILLCRPSRPGHVSWYPLRIPVGSHVRLHLTLDHLPHT